MVIHWSWLRTYPKEFWDKIAERMLLEFAESGCPIFRATTPLSRGQLKSKGHGKLSIHFAADQETIETVFRIIVSANHLSLYGAVAEIYEEYESLHERTGRPVVMGQSIVLSAIKKEVPLDSDVPANQNFVLQQFEERIEKLSQQDKLSKFCMDAGFLSVVQNGQYFMMKDTGDLTQFNTVACREYNLPREEAASQPKRWIQGHTQIGPVLEVATSYLHGKHGVEVRIMSLSRDNTHSWVRISHGSNKFVMNLNNNEQEIQLEEYALKLSAKDFACRSKAKAKIQRREPAGSSPRFVPIERRNWIDIEPGKYSLSEYEVSKKVIYLLRHSQQVHREEDGAVHFWRMKENLQNQFPQSIHWSDDRWKACLAAGGRSKKGDSSTVLMIQEQLFISELFKDIQELILHYRTMLLLRATSSSIFTILDVRSIFILSSTMDRYLEVKIRATDRQYSSCLLILWTKVTKILR